MMRSSGVLDFIGILLLAACARMALYSRLRRFANRCMLLFCRRGEGCTAGIWYSIGIICIERAIARFAVSGRSAAW